MLMGVKHSCHQTSASFITQTEKAEPFHLGFSSELLTSWVPPQDEFTDLIINEDKKAVGEGTEPPQDPEGEHKAQMKMEGTDAELAAANEPCFR